MSPRTPPPARPADRHRIRAYPMRFEPELMAAIKAMAQRNGRTFLGEVVHVMSRAVAEAAASSDREA